MIAKLAGVLDSVGEGWAVLDVEGVGYELSCSGRTLQALPPAGRPVRLYVDTQVREDTIQLFGFGDPNEREWFRLLQTVQGVGARVALGLLTLFSPTALAEAIASEDRAALARASGVGARLAGRIVGELKDRVELPAFGARAAAGAGAARAASEGSPLADAVSALVHLGYRPSEAHGAIAAASRNLGREAGVEALIREGLKGLNR